MKNFLLFLLVALMLGSQSVKADTYQHWITWYKPVDTKINHNATSVEMAEITSRLYRGDIEPFKKYVLATGIIYTIPQPKLYLEYIEKCVQVARPSAKTAQEVIDAIAGAEMTRWGNDISIVVKNYYFSSAHNRIQYNDNYSGSSLGVMVLVIDGAPAIKCDCGNPLEKINNVKIIDVSQDQEKSVVVISDKSKKEETLIDYGGVVKTEKKSPVVNPTVVDLGKKHKKDKSERTWVGRNLGWLIPAAIVVIAGSIIGAKELKKKPVAHQAHMSGGFGDENVTTTTTTTGGNTGTGGGFNN